MFLEFFKVVTDPLRLDKNQDGQTDVKLLLSIPYFEVEKKAA